MTPFDLGGWRAGGACREHPAEWWFDFSRGATDRAKAVCANCLVRAECLDYAVAHHEIAGIWGATTPFEREQLRAHQPTV